MLSSEMINTFKIIVLGEVSPSGLKMWKKGKQKINPHWQ